MRFLKVILISSVVLMLASAPVYAADSYDHPKPPDVVKPDLVKPDVVKGKVITKVPPNAQPPGSTTLGKVTEVPPSGILGTITDGPETGAGVLPFTGAQLTGITLLGLIAVGVGMVLTRARRRS